jgi:hypothetical protein
MNWNDRRVKNFAPPEYAALWGSNSEDGALFYNYAVEKNNPDFLRKFIPAIERMIANVVQTRATSPEVFGRYDVDDLKLLLEYVRREANIVVIRRVVAERLQNVYNVAIEPHENDELSPSDQAEVDEFRQAWKGIEQKLLDECKIA